MCRRNRELAWDSPVAHSVSSFFYFWCLQFNCAQSNVEELAAVRQTPVQLVERSSLCIFFAVLFLRWIPDSGLVYLLKTPAVNLNAYDALFDLIPAQNVLKPPGTKPRFNIAAYFRKRSKASSEIQPRFGNVSVPPLSASLDFMDLVVLPLSFLVPTSQQFRRWHNGA